MGTLWFPDVPCTSSPQHYWALPPSSLASLPHPRSQFHCTEAKQQMIEIFVSIIFPSACSSLTWLGIELGLLSCGPTTALDLMVLKKKKKNIRHWLSHTYHFWGFGTFSPDVVHCLPSMKLVVVEIPPFNWRWYFSLKYFFLFILLLGCNGREWCLVRKPILSSFLDSLQHLAFSTNS